MFCGKCGNEIEHGSMFCSNCGEKLDNDYVADGFGDDVEGFQTDYGTQYDESREIISDSSLYGQYPQAPSQDYNQYYDGSQPIAAPEKKKNKGLVIGLVITGVAVVTAIIAAVCIFLGDTDLDRMQFDTPDVTQSEGDAADGEFSDEDTVVEITGNTRILPAYEEGSVFAPEKLYNDADYYVSSNLAALYKESGGYARGQIAQLDTNDVVTVKGAMQDSNWVYVYCEELDIYGWIEPTSISSEPVDAYSAKADKREVIYYSENNCYDVFVSVGKGHNLNLRNIPSSLDEASVVRMVPDGEKVRVLGVSAANGEWYYVCYDSFDYGKLYGFMSGEYLAMDKM